MIKWIKILLGFDKPVIVWEKYYYFSDPGWSEKCVFRYTIYRYSLSGDYRLEMDPWKFTVIYTKYKANNMPMYIEAMKKLRELENDRNNMAH
jgi:hypothetical protein